MTMRPTDREQQLADWIGDYCPPREEVLARLVELREDLLRPFEAMRDDFKAMRDEKVVRCLDELLKAPRGEA